jgi:methylated-DNA-[protein]-cysteine S-methyltransferase
MEMRHGVVATVELGELTVVAADDTLAGVYFPGHWTMPDRTAFGEVAEVDDPVIAEAARQLRAYLRGERTRFELETSTRGGAFEERVWMLLREIPFGETVTYGDLAAELGDRSAARRVGQAVGRNPLSVVVPCHRVVGANGELRGYAGGFERKRFLLELEGAGQLSLGLGS